MATELEPQLQSYGLNHVLLKDMLKSYPLAPQDVTLFGNRKARPAKQPNCDHKGKVLEGDEKCYSSEHMHDKAEQPYC